MVYKIADNILSPLGDTTEQNYQAVKAGRSALSRYVNHSYLPEPFTASLFSETQNREISIEGLTRFESLAVRSAQEALSNVAFDPTAPNVIFILSSTKGNNECNKYSECNKHIGEDSEKHILEGSICNELDEADVFKYEENGLGESASRICQVLGISTPPVVVCNACISGASAIITAMRLIEAHAYDYAVVTGADALNRFMLSGFASLKALSADECRPFDMERLGLNLGEAAATIVLGRQPKSYVEHAWHIDAGVVRNDAYHISAPAKKGDGALLSLLSVIQGRKADEIAFINAHGTATMFNDQMESMAIERAGLADVPVNALKGYFGHTLGAAGILETVLSMRALDDGLILGTRGFEERGVSGKIQLSANHQSTVKKCFLKMISGFGGCNAAMLFDSSEPLQSSKFNAHSLKFKVQNSKLKAQSLRVLITPTQITVNGKPLAVEGTGKDMLTEAYKRYIDDYPKFYKMDMLSRLGFVASELLLAAEKTHIVQGDSQTIMQEDSQSHPTADRAVILFNHSSTRCADKSYFETICDNDNFFPSPSLFVYTLPNIVTGEIAIRNQYHGETAFYILKERNEKLMAQIQQTAFMDADTESILTGWLDYYDDQHFVADMYIIAK